VFSDSVCKLFLLIYTGTLDLFDVDGEYVYSAQVCVPDSTDFDSKFIF